VSNRWILFFSTVVFLFVARVSGAQTAAILEFSPAEWKYGVISRDAIIRREIVAINRGGKRIELSLVPTCSCLKVSPATLALAPGAGASFSLRFDPKDDEGKTQKFFIVKTDPPAAKSAYFVLSGVVRAGGPPAADRAAPSVGWARGSIAGAAGSATGAGSSGDSGVGSPVVKLSYYYMPGCRSCEKFLAVDLPALEARTGVTVEVERRDLLNDATYEELAAFASSIGGAIKAVPALRAGNELLQGEEEIRDRLPGLLVARAAGLKPGGSPAPEGPAWTGKTGAGEAGIGLSALPVIAAGLIDGINPCAFTTLIFLLASLALAGRGRREVLAIGAFFSAGVFLAYLGAGFGLFAALRAAQALALVSALIRWVLFAVLVAFAVLSAYDYSRIRAGKPSEMLLQLPDSLKLRIHASIRDRRRSSALALSSFVLGVLVSIFEFACTGQVYLPLLAYLARAKGRADALLLLLLYNLCFIAPLLVVFGASYYGVSSKRIAETFQKRMGAVKLLLAAVFAALAVLTILT
jgi:cytochrome c biogenesis protein CcdA